MQASRLRELVAKHVIAAIHSGTHKTIPATCESLGVPQPGELGTKYERAQRAFEMVREEDLERVAERLLDLGTLAAAARNELQEELWRAAPGPAIPARYRREVAQALEPVAFYVDRRHFDALLDSLWVIDTDPLAAVFGGRDDSLKAQIERHVHRNPGDWSTTELFDKLGAFECTDRRFALFLEGLAGPRVRPDEPNQREFAAAVNPVLHRCAVELREVDTDGGYPLFRVVALARGAVGRPKNLIFASSVKPDLRLIDAVANDIEIVTGADQVLVYDRPIGPDGLRWRDLQAWWAESHEIGDADVAKATLYRRLQSCLPSSSPPQRTLFCAYHRHFGAAVPDLPALLPEVWLHWDPKRAGERGPMALPRFRMDFLLLLPGNGRVVVEVDGRHHYADPEGRASPERYASMVAADRDLRLVGYEVFRFGAVELDGEDVEARIGAFFERLFARYAIAVSGSPA